MKVYPEADLSDFIDRNGCIVQSDLDENQLTPIELRSYEEIEKHIEYLKKCKQNLIDNADNMPQHLLEGGCMAFESAIDNAEELLKKHIKIISNNKQSSVYELCDSFYEESIDQSNIPREHYEYEIKRLMIEFAIYYNETYAGNKWATINR